VIRSVEAVYNLQACRENDILESTARKRGSPVLDAVLKLNNLHLIVTCCDGAAILALLREARGRTPPPVQLFNAVPRSPSPQPHCCSQWERPRPARHACGWPGWSPA